MRVLSVSVLLGRALLRLAPLALLAAPVLPAGEPVIRLAGPEELPAAAARARPGDTLVLPDGLYRDRRLVFRAAGAEGRPITLRPATPGGATFTGRSSLEVQGAWLVVSGLRFEGCTVAPIVLRGARSCRVTGCAVIRCNPETNTRMHWLHITGTGSRDNRIDHCRFEGKYRDGVVLVVGGDRGTLATDTRIDHNDFRDVVRAVPNGMETIRIGTSDVQRLEARAVVEWNRFERASGDAEIISSKSCGNLFRYNTFVECEGGVVMRHGARCVVEGNFFFGGGRKRTAGIRLHGAGHRVVNNYLEGLADFGIAVPAGQARFETTGHEPASDAVIAHNTLVDLAGPALVIGDRSLGPDRDTPPRDLLWIDNLVASTATPLRDESPASSRWAGNLFESPGRAEARPGIRYGTVGLRRATDGLWRPAPDSPAVDAGVPAPFPIPDDMDGQPRDRRPDVGADERAEGPVVRRPLRPDDVGPEWLRGRPVAGAAVRDGRE